MPYREVQTHESLLHHHHHHRKQQETKWEKKIVTHWTERTPPPPTPTMINQTRNQLRGHVSLSPPPLKLHIHQLHTLNIIWYSPLDFTTSTPVTLIRSVPVRTDKKKNSNISLSIASTPTPPPKIRMHALAAIIVPLLSSIYIIKHNNHIPLYTC
jgi:hypothetical protein